MPRASQTAPGRSLLERSLLDRWRAATAQPDGVWLDGSLADLPPSGSVERVMVLHALVDLAVARIVTDETASLTEAAATRVDAALADGMGELRLIGPAPDARALHDALTRRAQDRSRCGDADPYADLVAATGPAAPGADDPGSRASATAGALGTVRRTVSDRRTLDARRLDAAITALAAVASDPDGVTAPWSSSPWASRRRWASTRARASCRAMVRCPP